LENIVQLAPSALHATAETLTGYLGTDNWQVNELIIDSIISLEGPHDRQIGMRLLGDGSSIQLWATGGTEPADHEPIEGTIPLPRFHRWHTPVHIGALEADKDPAVVLYDAITDRLLPVFDAKPLYVGHRPWDPAVALETDAQPDAEAADSAATDQPEPQLQAPAEPAAKLIRMRTRRAKPTAAKAADGEPKPRSARKRTAKPAVAKAEPQAADAELKSRPARKPATS